MSLTYFYQIHIYMFPFLCNSDPIRIEGLLVIVVCVVTNQMRLMTRGGTSIPKVQKGKSFDLGQYQELQNHKCTTQKNKNGTFKTGDGLTFDRRYLKQGCTCTCLVAFKTREELASDQQHLKQGMNSIASDWQHLHVRRG